MEVHYGYRGNEFDSPVITMGVFDGVHLGHRMLLSRVAEEAGKSRSDSVAVTFDPHPRIVLTGDPSGLRFLTDIEERIYLLRQTGIGHLVIIPFTHELSRMTAREFVDQILCRHLNLRHLIVGFNHHFGRRLEGDSVTIADCASRKDFRVTREEAFMIDGEVVSSSVIRRLLEGGEVRKASAMLGYDYTLRGKVVSGKKIGRGLGFPTANIAPLFAYKLIPRAGVYAVEIMVEGETVWHAAMLNIGLRPTISENDGRSTIEAHIIDFESDLYGKTVTVRFCERLRDEMKFRDTDALAAQLANDRERAIALLRR
jgi:riboflavin kinase / FMN adenylyltransferase